MTQRLCRTFQTAPVAVASDDTAKYLRSGLTASGFQAPDWLVPDLEDGTAPAKKEEGMENLLALLPEYAPEFSGEILPRIEWAYDAPATTERGHEQIDRIVENAGEHVDGIVVPKVGRVGDVESALSAVADAEREYGLPQGSIEVAVIVETARARSDLREIGALGNGRSEDGSDTTARLAGLVFGPVDYTAELGGRSRDGDRFEWPALLEALSNEASANDVVAVGGPFDRLFAERAGVSFYNGSEYAEQVEREAAVGLDGSWSLHPKQTTQANRIHMPTPDELERDVEKIERFAEAKASGTGAVSIDGQMVDEATLKNFQNTVWTARVIADRHPEQAEAVYDEALLERARSIELR
ncbi:L-malyl-CoA/beta-methylmalyl-CoA lyase [Salinarchaeum laminariae]|uniref:L-malyl-CoA/beta-methylmalyl-CoA lyase n=1 Tax=Salinarchaeum laminariae TaxID=869888 RepID=UPI0020BFE179|nr:L-malyl-CoA/beta-methylmalyl-CoA lyase [Salinarchaeum laminariae]